jgi:hypothetical protein
MKLTTFAGLLLLLSTAHALAEDWPSPILNDSQCQGVWSLASANGVTLSRAEASPTSLTSIS